MSQCKTTVKRQQRSVATSNWDWLPVTLLPSLKRVANTRLHSNKMATSNAETEESKISRREHDFRRTCGLCMEPYKGRNPKILPCFHTFCLSCLTSLAKTVTNSTRDNPLEKGEGGVEEAGDRSTEMEGETKEGMGEGTEMSEKNGEGDKSDKNFADLGGEGEKEGREVSGNHGDVFLCPTCRAPVTIPRGGVAALQNNFYLKHEDTDDITHPPPQCDVCEEAASQEASFTCDKCRQRMCRTCRRLHDKFTDPREHHVRALDIHEMTWMTPAPIKRCSTHPGQELCFHCQKCDVSICLHCKLTSHEGHATEDVATAAVRAKEEITAVLSEVNKQLRSVEAAVGRLERDEGELSRQKEELTQQANTRYDVIVAWAARARDEFLESLTAKARTSLHDISSEKTAARVAMDTLSGAVSRASRQSALGPDTVMMKNELQAALLDKNVLDGYNELEDRKDNLTFFTCQADADAVDLDTLRTYTGVLAEEEESEESKTPPLSQKELTSKVLQLEAALDTLTEKQSSSFKELNDSVTTLQAELSGKDERTKISFHARMTAGGEFSAADQTLVFNSAVSNEGGGYDPTTGIFTAPETGTYIFIVTVDSFPKTKNVNLKLVLENAELANFNACSSSTAHAVVRVDKGKRVWIGTKDKTSFSCLSTATTFSGAIL